MIFPPKIVEKCPQAITLLRKWERCDGLRICGVWGLPVESLSGGLSEVDAGSVEDSVVVQEQTFLRRVEQRGGKRLASQGGRAPRGGLRKIRECAGFGMEFAMEEE